MDGEICCSISSWVGGSGLRIDVVPLGGDDPLSQPSPPRSPSSAPRSNDADARPRLSPGSDPSHRYCSDGYTESDETGQVPPHDDVARWRIVRPGQIAGQRDRKSTRLNSSH